MQQAVVDEVVLAVRFLVLQFAVKVFKWKYQPRFVHIFHVIDDSIGTDFLPVLLTMVAIRLYDCGCFTLSAILRIITRSAKSFRILYLATKSPKKILLNRLLIHWRGFSYRLFQANRHVESICRQVSQFLCCVYKVHSLYASQCR